MLKKTLLLALILISSSACSKQEKVRLEGTRITIKPEQTSLQANPLLADFRVILPKQINYQDWTQSGGFADHAPLHPKIDTVVKKAWKKSTGPKLKDYQIFLASPLVYNGKIYTINTKNELIEMDTDNGKQTWSLPLKSELKRKNIITPGTLAIDGASIVAVLSSGDIYAINLVTKQVRWHKQLKEPFRASPTISDGKIFITSLNNKMYALNLGDGSVVWTHSGLSEKLTILGDSSPAVAQGVVVVTYSSGEVYALDVATGGEIWSDALVKTSTFDLTQNILDVVASPVIVGNLLHVVNYNGKLTTFNLKTGQKYWTRHVSSVTTPWIAGNSIFIVAENGLLACIYRKTGQVKWVTDLNETMHKSLNNEDKVGSVFTSPLLAGNRLVLGSNKGFVASFNPNTGEMARQVNIKEGISVNPIVAEQSLYFLTNNSNIISYK